VKLRLEETVLPLKHLIVYIEVAVIGGVLTVPETPETDNPGPVTVQEVAGEASQEIVQLSPLLTVCSLPIVTETPPPPPTLLPVLIFISVAGQKSSDGDGDDDDDKEKDSKKNAKLE
jgi:hypothetical protein